MRYLFDAAGDAAAKVNDDGTTETVDPDEEWRHRKPDNARTPRTLHDLVVCGPFTVTVPDETFATTPGRRIRSSVTRASTSGALTVPQPRT
ncbi:MAG TPA: hypothetical protein VGJ86_22890 [Acidimicrobiales bacterium]|jgi:hypothetical protein